LLCLIQPIEELLNFGRILRFYLDELREVESLGTSTLQLIMVPSEIALKQGKQLISRVRQEFANVRQQQKLLELIEIILVFVGLDLCDRGRHRSKQSFIVKIWSKLNFSSKYREGFFCSAIALAPLEHKLSLSQDSRKILIASKP
jgi:predicted transposase YdaD